MKFPKVAMALAIAALPSLAFAQSSPGLTFKQVPTAGQWNSYFAAKQDVLGYVPLNVAGGTMTGRLVTAAPSASVSGLNLTPGSTPGSPVNGDIWVTSAGLFARINGATVGPMSGAVASSIGIGTTGISGGANGNILSVSGGFLAQIATTGSGSVALATSPTFVTPILGSATGTSLALGGCTIGIAALCANGSETIISSASNALVVGANGSINPVLQVDGSVASQAIGIKFTGGASGAGIDAVVIAPGASENLRVNAKGSGAVAIGGNSTGGVQLAAGGGGVTAPTLALGGCLVASNAFCTTGASVLGGAVTITSNNPAALAVGPNGSTNPALQIDASTASVATGLSIKGAAAGAGVAIAVISSGTNESATINAKGSGAIAIGNISTGGVALGAGGAGVTATALTVNTSFTATGLVGYSALASAAIANASNYFSGAPNVVVPASVIYQAETTTTYGTTTAFDFSTFINTAVTLTGNITTMTLNNVKAGQAGTIAFIQDATGSRTTVWNSIFKFNGGVTPTLTTTANAVDVLSYSCRSATFCVASLIQNVK